MKVIDARKTLQHFLSVSVKYLTKSAWITRDRNALFKPVPMPRSTRTRTQTTYADADSSDPEGTPKAKKPGRSGKKKRVSDVFVPQSKNVAEAEDVRTPLKSVSINDDLAEKRRRRKSIKPSRPPMEDADAAPGAADDGGTPRAGANARPNQLNVVEDAPIINVPLDVMSSNFEEWMKMATDNVNYSLAYFLLK
jgi:condensin complex subunit 2